MRKYREDIVAVLLSLSSLAVVVFVAVYIINLQPYAKKADVDAVKQTAVAALKQTHVEQATQDQASALVSTMSEKHTKQLRTDGARIGQCESDIADLKSRVAALRQGQTVEQGEIDRLR